jgi:hypothetical protein
MEPVQFTMEPHSKFTTEPQSTLTSTPRMVINFCSRVSVVSLKVTKCFRWRGCLILNACVAGDEVKGGEK